MATNNAYDNLFANLTILTQLLNSLSIQKNAPHTSTFFREEYDYIIVGAGSAGAAVASRLSENQCVSVLLLEAGRSPPILNDVPVLARNFWFSDLDWAYKTVPQKHAGFGLVNNQVIWPSGKGLGGSSLLNGMIYVRGNRKNYDDWEKQGAEGWSYEDVLPYFKKLEDNKDPELLANGYHATGGPVTVDRPRYAAEIKQPLIDAGILLGYHVVDANGPNQTGFYDQQANMRNGQRCSSAKAYLVPAENRPNLDIQTFAFVKKVLIRNMRAIGVLFDHRGSTIAIKAKREVIISAGAINSAQILMLSGIGPKKHLEDLNITVIADLPVGDNLQDHQAVPVPFQINPTIPSILDKALNPVSSVNYIVKREGVFTSTEGISLIAFLNAPNRRDVKFPDFQLYFVEVPDYYARTQFGIKPEVYEKTFSPYLNSTMYICMAQILHPNSRGTVRLKSTDPYDHPLIDPNYFADPSDVKDVVEGMKMCITIGTSKPMQRVGSIRLLNLVPGCENLSGDRYLECYARSIIVTNSHPVGTAKMGDPKDPYTVVDPQLRVKGFEGLRVVDASIMPLIPYGNTNIPCMMVGEKASDIIKETIRETC